VRFVAWAFVLMLQAGASTWASRARNTESVRYHAVAAVFSHGVWFVSNALMVDTLVKDGVPVALLGVFYTTFTVAGSVLAHAIEKRFKR
jgi:hypothetical protein